MSKLVKSFIRYAITLTIPPHPVPNIKLKRQKINAALSGKINQLYDKYVQKNLQKHHSRMFIRWGYNKSHLQNIPDRRIQ
ncbi:MAG: hypothetical protein B6D39_12105 [Anaerolineae bacterium UTCFX2]|nr:MAG: hypothetical protein B6D39_12105 [Anaerolineae bacterium UTCFX2]